MAAISMMLVSSAVLVMTEADSKEAIMVSDGQDSFVADRTDSIITAVKDADGGEITINSDLDGQTFSFEYTEENPARIQMRSNLTPDTLNLKWAEVSVKTGKKLSGTFANGDSKVVIADSRTNDKTTLSTDDKGMTVSGAIIDDRDKSYTIKLEGDTTMDNLKLEWGSFMRKGEFEYPTIEFAGNTTITGKGNKIWDSSSSEELRRDTSVLVSGTVNVDNGAVLTIISDLDVTGNVVIAEKGDQKMSGRMIVEGNVYVGFQKKDLYSPESAASAEGISKYGKSYGRALSSNATISGKLEVDDGYYITVRAGSTVDPSIIKDMDSIEVFVGGELWMTVYGKGTYNLDGVKIPLGGCLVEGASSLKDSGKVVDGKDRLIAKYDHEEGVIYDSSDISFSDNTGVHLNLRYDVFNIYFTTDSNIKAVFVDNILATNSHASNVFVAAKMLSGQHTVRVEPITGYDITDATIYDDKGNECEGMNITFSADDCQQDTLDVSYNISCTVQEKAPSIAGLGITTVLLMALVIIVVASTAAVAVWYRGR